MDKEELRLHGSTATFHSECRHEQDITELMMAAIAAVIAETQADGDDLTGGPPTRCGMVKTTVAK